MQFIELTQGYITVVDDNWYELLSTLSWEIHGSGNSKYASCYIKEKGKPELLHRVIMGAMPDQFVDHVDGNRLNNQISNLRICNKSENMMNSKPRIRRKNIGSTSLYKGVYFTNRSNVNKKWSAYITKDGKRQRYKSFLTEREAAEAYDKWAIELFGDFARTNFPREGVTQEKYFEF